MEARSGKTNHECFARARVVTRRANRPTVCVQAELG